MATILDTPIDHTRTEVEQKVDSITISLSSNYLQFSVVGTNGGQVINENSYSYKIKDAEGVVLLPAAIEAAARAFHNAITTAAKNVGHIGAGNTTDDI